MGVLRVRAGRVFAAALSAAMLAAALAACDPVVEVPSATPPTSGPAGLGGPSISMEETWNLLNGVWTFSGRVDPRESETTVVMDVGYDIIDPNAFEESIPVAAGLLEPGPISGTVTTPDTQWLCVRFRAENADGDAVTPRQCFPTDLPGARPSGEPAPSGSPAPGSS